MSPPTKSGIHSIALENGDLYEYRWKLSPKGEVVFTSVRMAELGQETSPDDEMEFSINENGSVEIGQGCGNAQYDMELARGLARAFAETRELVKRQRAHAK